MRFTIQYLFTILALLYSVFGISQISTTVHNLSSSGPGDIKSFAETEICIFCHTTHNSKPKAPLWNRQDPGSYYQIYDKRTSSTINAIPGQPDGSSSLCLSCHDGTIALGSVLSRKEEISFGGSIRTMPAGKSNLSTNLTDDHPISFIYDAALATADGQLRQPAAILKPVNLDASSKVQCTSCHDPHDNANGQFLHMTDRYSELCISCHDLENWRTSSHSTSSSTWNNTGKSPWSHLSKPYSTVAENGCQNCHGSHAAGGKERLMKSDIEENNCLDCHNGAVAKTNIELQLTKSYSHNVFNYVGIHDQLEETLTRNKHVECEDCHNPHNVNNTTANAPFVKGSNAGARGIDISGNIINDVQYEYEICFRCHSENAISASPISRQIEQNNVRLEFSAENPSFHPVANRGVNQNVPSLMSPLNTTSKIYCTDCHSSDGDGPAGPHGSVHQFQLKYRYEIKDGTFESESSYELCYSCHDRNSILGDASFKLHSLHISEERTSCAVCHDPHGISASQGNSINNSNLINFNLRVVSENAAGELGFEDTGRHSGYCNLKCHGKTHDSRMTY